MGDRHYLEVAVPLLDGLERVAIRLHAGSVEERRFVNEQEPKLHPCLAALDFGKSEDNREGCFDALAAAPAHVREPPGVAVVDDDVKGCDLFLAVGFQHLFRHKLHAHAPLRHLAEDIGGRRLKYRDNAADDVVGNTVLRECLFQLLVPGCLAPQLVHLLLQLCCLLAGEANLAELCLQSADTEGKLLRLLLNGLDLRLRRVHLRLQFLSADRLALLVGQLCAGLPDFSLDFRQLGAEFQNPLGCRRFLLSRHGELLFLVQPAALCQERPL